ncbi:helix-turn-helix domain-containing protein [Nocardioides silvaticus]|nr:helix-turn-helix domain-containing protein [Nocardioides silvaticus]
MRVWELAESLRITTAELLALIEPYDKYVTSHLATIPEMALRAIQSDPPAPTRKFSDYYWHAEPRPRPRPSPAPPAASRLGGNPFSGRRGRLRRRPGPRPVSFEPPYEEDDHGWGNDPTADLKYEPIWSTRDVARYYDVKPATVRQWVARGYLTPEGKEGPSHVFARNEVMDAWADISARRNESGKASSQSWPPSRPRGLHATDLDRLNKVTPESLVTITEAAVMLGLAPATIRSWIRRGHITPHPTSTPRRTLVSVADVHAAARRKRH